MRAAATSGYGRCVSEDDPFWWLRDDTRRDPAVLAHLAAENERTRKTMAEAKPLEESVFAEFRARVKDDDADVPTFEDGYWYYTRYEPGSQYSIYARKRRTLDAPEEVLLDVEQLARGHEFYAIGGHAVSRDGRLLAFAEDTVGRRQSVLRIKDLVTGELLPDTAANIAGDIVWANDNRTLFFVGRDETTLREDRVFRHVLGRGTELVFQEDDGKFYVGITPLKSRRYVAITLDATTTSEIQLLDADAPTAPPRALLPRAPDHLYVADHLDDRFVLLTNDRAINFRVIEVADGAERDRSAWQELVPHRPDVLIEDFAVYRGFLAMTVVSGGLRKVEVVPESRATFHVDAPDPTYAMTMIDTPDPDAGCVRYTYESMTRPTAVIELDVASGKRTTRKQQAVPTYDPALYTSELLQAEATDGTMVPVSVVRKKSTPLDGSAPVLIYAYGAYGASTIPRYSLTVTSLLDRGWVYAIAHVRGGQELGRAWYDHGRLQHKKNTFHDFIAASEHLVARRFAARERVFALGASAGGLLVGAILNMRPDLYRGVIAIVPFVDLVTTMKDPSVPLTTNEYEEWGNPEDPEALAYMLSYSPYDNIAEVPYPAVFCKTTLWDSQVQYYEPTRWIAKLRAHTTSSNPVLLDCAMSEGHNGASGRFDKLRDTARMYAFLLMTDATPDPR